MNRVKKTTCIFLLITTPILTTATQTVPAKKSVTEQAASEKAQPRSPLLQKIISVLDQVLDAQNSFSDAPLRILIQANVADVLWSYDQPRARRLFEGALQETARLPEPSASARSQGTAGLPSNARASVIRLIMPHDSDWATRLVESAGEIANADAKARTAAPYRERAMLQVYLAFYFAQQDPQRAVRVVKPFAENGDVNSLMMALGMIRSKDAAAADELFNQVLAKAKLSQTGFNDINRLATYLFPSFGEGVIHFSLSTNGATRDPFAPVSTDPAMVQQFLDLAYEVTTKRFDAAMRGADDARLDARSVLDYGIPKTLEPYFDRFMPERAAAFRARVDEALRHVPTEQRPYLILTEPSTVQELLSRAEAIADAALKDSLYRRATQQASASGDFEQAAAIIERLTTERVRSSLKNELRQRMDQNSSDEAWSALNTGDFDKAEPLVARISQWRSSALLMRSLVGQLASRDRARAARILDEYQRRARENQDGIERAQQLMELAAVAANIDRNRAFEEMKLAIDEFNRAGFAPELQKNRDGDGKGGTAATVNIGLGWLLGNWNFQWLGRTDFDRAILLTREFQMREASALMQLEVCRGALSGVQQASPKPIALDANQTRALALLDQLQQAAKSFEDGEIRIRVQVQIADLLWQRDERRARRLFETAFQGIASTSLPPQDKNAPPSYIGADSHFPLRSDVVRMVAQHDTSLAAKLIDSVVDQPPNIDPKFTASGYGNYSEQDMLRLQFAAYITHSDPQRAGQIANTFSQKGDLRSTVSILESLRDKDRSLADDLFGQTLARVRQSGATSSENVRLLADYVFPGFGEGTIRFTNGSRPPSETEKASAELTAQFLDLAYNAIMRGGSVAEQKADDRQQSDRTIAKLLIPFFDKYMADKSAALRTRLAGSSSETSEVAELDDVQELLNRAEKAPDSNAKDAIYSNAIMNAMRRRDLDRASQILEKVSNDRMRSQLTQALNRAREQERYQKAQTLLSSGDFDAAYDLIKEFSDRNQRFGLLCNMVGSLTYKKETTRALQVLGEAEQQIRTSEDGIDKARNLLQLAGVAGRLDPKRGFEDMKAAVDAINRIELAPQWQKLETVSDAKNGFSTRRNIGLGALFFFLDNSLSQIARADFDRTLQLAQGIQMREASVLAQLAVCRAVLVPSNARR